MLIVQIFLQQLSRSENGQFGCLLTQCLESLIALLLYGATRLFEKLLGVGFGAFLHVSSDLFGVFARFVNRSLSFCLRLVECLFVLLGGPFSLGTRFIGLLKCFADARFSLVECRQ